MDRYEPWRDGTPERRPPVARTGPMEQALAGSWLGTDGRSAGRPAGLWPGVSAAAQVLQLQRTAGNAAVAAYLGSSIQRDFDGTPTQDQVTTDAAGELPVPLCAGGIHDVAPLQVDADAESGTAIAQTLPADTDSPDEATPLDAPAGSGAGGTAATAACPVPADLSKFQDKPGGDGSGLAALTATGLGGFQHGTFVVTHDPAASWVDTNIVTWGGKRAGNTKKRIADGLASFAKGNTTFTSTGQTSCAAAPSVTRTANSVAEMESVIGAGLDADGIADEPRLLTHEQYHVKLVCAAAKKAAATLPAGTTKVTKQVKAVYDALGQVIQTNSDAYDVATSNGCDAGAQKTWQTDIDTGKVAIKR